MDWEILDDKRKNILTNFAFTKSNFYLAGGTALALQLGHRDSVDFDFFTDGKFSPTEIYENLKLSFGEVEIKKIVEDSKTLTVIIDKTIKVSFFYYGYKLLKSVIETEFFNLASVEDIGAMKLSAIVSRAVMKDYVDLYWILKQMTLKELLAGCQQKFPELETNLVVKSLVFFDDLEKETIIFKNNHQVELEEVESELKRRVAEYSRG